MIGYLSIIGIILSAYMLHVRRNVKQQNYHSACDINDRISCSQVAKSEYGKTLYVENGILGIAFYLLVYYANTVHAQTALLILGLSGLGMSMYLITKLIKLKMICPVCIGIHLVNFILFGITLVQYL